MRLRAATRGSALARRQTDHIASLLRALDPDVEIEPVVVTTTGDRLADVPIHELGGKGVFVKEVQLAVLEGRADVAVHSGKDLPARTPEGLVVAAVPERADPRDALVGATLDELGEGAVVATGSVRRRSQLAWHRPELRFAELRGNIDTRLGRADQFDAIVVAAAALDRLGRTPSVVERLDPDLIIPQAAQGALAVECRVDDHDLRHLLAHIQDRSARHCFDAERAFLAELGGDCDLPAGAHATLDVGHGRPRSEGTLRLRAMLASPDGRVMLRESRVGDDAEMLGRVVARHLLDDAGGARLLAT